jgi:hypothetical protein
VVIRESEVKSLRYARVKSLSGALPAPGANLGSTANELKNMVVSELVACRELDAIEER